MISTQVGEVQDYEGGNAKRVTDAEKRSADRMQEGLWNKVRHASEVHRQVRRYAQSFIKPGLSLTEMCEKIEQKNRHDLGVPSCRGAFTSLI